MRTRTLLILTALTILAATVILSVLSLNRPSISNVQTCLPTACLYAVDIRFTGEVPRDYSVSTTRDGLTVSITCPDGDSTDTLQCTEDGVLLIIPDGNTFTITWQDGSKTATIQPDYRAIPQTGPTCSQVCFDSQVKISLP